MGRVAYVHKLYSNNYLYIDHTHYSTNSTVNTADHIHCNCGGDSDGVALLNKFALFIFQSQNEKAGNEAESDIFFT